LPVDAAVLEYVGSPRPLDDRLGDLFRQGFSRVVSKVFEDGERIKQRSGRRSPLERDGRQKPMTDCSEDVMLPPEFREHINLAAARRSTDQTGVRQQCVPGGDGGDCSIDALVALMRLQNGVEHVGDARQPPLGFVHLLKKRVLDTLLGLVVGAADQPLEQGECCVNKASLDIAQGCGHDGGALRHSHLLESLCGEAQALAHHLLLACTNLGR
jgi:hypothetical protein